jgi:hypothetical protein
MTDRRQEGVDMDQMGEGVFFLRVSACLIHADATQPHRHKEVARWDLDLYLGFVLVEEPNGHFFSWRTQVRMHSRLRTQMVTSLVRGPR